MGRKAQDLFGVRFGHLRAIRLCRERSNPGRQYWVCRCDCGIEKSILVSTLRSGQTISCGCYRNEQASKRMIKMQLKHGLSKTPTYTIWKGAMNRCYREKNKDYPSYGGRGITMFKDWHDFTVFLAEVGERPGPEYSLDRINNNGSYEPGNVRWATIAQQQENRSITVRLTVDGVEKTLMEWLEMTGQNRSTVNKRLKKGWTAKEALFTKPRNWADIRTDRKHRDSLSAVSAEDADVS